MITTMGPAGIRHRLAVGSPTPKIYVANIRDALIAGRSRRQGRLHRERHRPYLAKLDALEAGGCGM